MMKHFSFSRHYSSDGIFFYEKFVSDEGFRTGILFVSSCFVDLSYLKKFLDVDRKARNRSDLESRLMLGMKLKESALKSRKEVWENEITIGKFSPSKYARYDYVRFEVERVDGFRERFDRALGFLEQHYKAELSEMQPQLPLCDADADGKPDLGLTSKDCKAMERNIQYARIYQR